MFTGIIEQVGIIAALIRGSHSAKLAISAGKYFDEVKVGDSLAVNGVCLTVTNSRRGMVEFDLSSESLKRSTFRDARIGEKVNLEKALPVNGRLGGHVVTGHIDGVGEIRNKVNLADGIELSLSVPSEILRYLVTKGSMTIDGISLTVGDFIDGLLHLYVIPHTAKNTTLNDLKIGDKVNIEVDILSKYIEKHLRGEPKGMIDDTIVKMGFMPMGWTDN